ncbi:unnamed protein product [Prorocentrum cordatum]|uniref:Pre-mRNA-splicing factor 38 n=1 Tax=Prorocentrum cordatum TaxID=2364126 RepID=A0ABN9WEB6_9DINO|nr:unnamed protein product [Polarella glacialis]
MLHLALPFGGFLGFKGVAFSFGTVALVPHLPPPGLPGLPAPAVPGGGEGLWAPALLQPPLQHAGPAQPEAPASEGEGATPPEVKRCHLHKKPNKACKFCQRFSQAQSAATQAAPQTAAAKTGAGGTSEESGKPTFSCSPMLKDQILKSSYFKSLLDNAGTVDALAEEISGFADDLDVYQAGSTTSPSVFFCCVFRLFTLEHTVEELHWLLDHSESVPVRCAACLFARFSLRPDRLWDTLEEYMLDDQDLGDFRVKQPSLPPTVGEYVESLLTKDKYFGTPLPRLPVVVRRKLEEHLAPLSQYRKRAQANQHEMRLFQKPGTPVEVCHKGEWVGGRVTGLMASSPA